MNTRWRNKKESAIFKAQLTALNLVGEDLIQDTEKRKPGENFLNGILWPFREIYHFVTKSTRRAEVFTAFKHGSKYFQRSTYTTLNRYPLLFNQCRLLLQDVKQPALLSYGCSTGEEVISLSYYLPEARIMGVDINPRCIRICNKKNRNALHVFCEVGDPLFTKSGLFDAIFCMAVFQRIENRPYIPGRRATGFTFQVFEAEIELLHNKLRTGGYFFITESDFSFLDTRFAACYEPVIFEGNMRELNRPLYDTDGHQVARTQALYRCFVKTGTGNT